MRRLALVLERDDRRGSPFDVCRVVGGDADGEMRLKY